MTSNTRMTALRTTTGRHRALVGVGLIAVAAMSSGCNNAAEGALSGAAIGALGGLAIGSMTGSAGTGAAIGAISGAAVGGVIGDQNQRAERRPLHNW